MKAVKAFKRNILKICKEHDFDIERRGEMTVGQAEYDAGSGIMPLFIQRVNKYFIRVAHYYTQNGDSMADPEIFFWVSPNSDWYPHEYRQDNLGIHQQLLKGEWIDNKWIPKAVMGRHYSVASFCTTWGRNIAWQQAGNSATIHYYDEPELLSEGQLKDWQYQIRDILRKAQLVEKQKPLYVEKIEILWSESVFLPDGMIFNTVKEFDAAIRQAAYKRSPEGYTGPSGYDKTKYRVFWSDGDTDEYRTDVGDDYTFQYEFYAERKQYRVWLLSKPEYWKDYQTDEETLRSTLAALDESERYQNMIERKAG